jgi:regulator of RNase E activity RraA
MSPSTTAARIEGLTTPNLADACVRLGLPLRVGPAGLRPVVPGQRCHGPARPVRHVGAFEIFFEALEIARPGELLVVDNAGRLDEACIGDLVALEIQQAGLAGILIWGLHRDGAEIAQMGFPLFSLGAVPNSPRRLDPRADGALARAQIGEALVTPDDYAVCDGDGAVFLPAAELPAILDAAELIRDSERQRAAEMRRGASFRAQTRFGDFLGRRAAQPDYAFKAHMKTLAAT